MAAFMRFFFNVFAWQHVCIDGEEAEGVEEF